MTDSFAKKTDTELRKLLSEKREALRQFRFSAAGSKSRNVREGRALRRDVARIMTTLASRPR